MPHPVGRPNAVDASPAKLEIIRAMLAGRKASEIAKQYGLHPSAIHRYQHKRLKRYLAAGDPALEIERKDMERNQISAVQDIVMDDVRRIRKAGWSLIESMMEPDKIKTLDCDPKASASLLREIRENARLQAQLDGRLQDRSATQVNVVILSAAPEHQAPHQAPYQAQIANPPVDDVLDAEWCEISPGS
jgi:hypothetical protein